MILKNKYKWSIIMKTIAKIILYLLMMVQMSSLSFADADPANPAKTQKPCGFPDDMNCFENKKVADADEVNANFKALLNRVDNINSVNGNIGIGTTAKNNILHIKGSVSINNGDTEGEHHAIGGMSIIHGGPNFPYRALQIRPGENSLDSYILHASRDESGNFFWWTYSVLQDKTFRINPLYSSEGLVIAPNGFVGIGHIYPTHRLHVNGIARADQATFDTSSDRRVKKNITPLTGSLQKIQQIQPVSFEYTDDYKQGKNSLDGKQMGFIAQDVKQICPEMVTTEKETFGDQTIEDFHLLNTSNLTPMLIDAIKELKAEVDTLKARIEALESKNSGLFSEN
jgi:hypothetical protein